MSYLMKVSRVYYIRVRVPSDLLHHFPTRELKRSLRTRLITEARRLAPGVLAIIMSTFQELRSNQMHKEPTITAEAVSIFRRLYPGVDTHDWVDVTQDRGGWVIDVGQREVANPALVKIQDQLDEGWQFDESGEREFVGVQAPETLSPVPIYPVSIIPATPMPAPIPAAKPKKSAMLSKAKELWLDHLTAPADTVHYTAKAASTIRSSRYALEVLSDWLGNKDVTVESLLDRDFRKLTVFMTDGTLGKNSAKTRLLRIVAFFKFLHDDLKTIDRIPTIHFPKLNADEQESLDRANSPYTNEELNRFLTFVVDANNHKVADRKTALSLAYLILTFIYTGFRTSEQLSFTREKIKKVAGIYYFDFTTKTKGTKSAVRMIPVHSKLLELGFMQFADKQSELIFSLDVTTYRRNFDLILKALNIKGKRGEKTFHSCRKTFDSWLYGDIEDSSRNMFMGHTQKGMDNVYLRQLPDKMPAYKRDIEKLVYKLDFLRFKKHLLTEIAELYP